MVCCFRFVSKALSQKTIGLLPEVGIILSAHCPINDFDPRIKTEPVTAGCECNVICPAFAVISNDAGAPTVTGTGFYAVSQICFGTVSTVFVNCPMLSFLELLTVEGERCNCLVSGWTVSTVCVINSPKLI